MCVTCGLASGTLPDEKWGLHHGGVRDLSLLLLSATLSFEFNAAAPFLKGASES